MTRARPTICGHRMTTMLLGQPGFFTPQTPNPWFSLRGSRTATSFYDDAPLRETLLRLVDFDLLNRRRPATPAARSTC